MHHNDYRMNVQMEMHMKVLIVDDNVELASALRSVVEKEMKCRVQTAQDGTKGYREYLSFKPDLVITDIEMPGKNGFELMKEIRVHDPDIKTIYMSGDPFSFQSLVEEEEKQYGVTFLGKPFSFERLTNLLEKCA